MTCEHKSKDMNHKVKVKDSRSRTVKCVLEDPRGQGHVLENSVTGCGRSNFMNQCECFRHFLSNFDFI